MSLIGWTVATRRNNLPSAGAGRTWRRASPPVAPQRALSEGSGAFSADSGLHLSRVSVTRFRGVDGLLRGFPCWLWGRLLSACERELVLARARPCRGQVVAVVRGDSTLTTLTLPRRPHAPFGDPSSRDGDSCPSSPPPRLAPARPRSCSSGSEGGRLAGPRPSPDGYRPASPEAVGRWQILLGAVAAQLLGVGFSLLPLTRARPFPFVPGWLSSLVKTGSWFRQMASWVRRSDHGVLVFILFTRLMTAVVLPEPAVLFPIMGQTCCRCPEACPTEEGLQRMAVVSPAASLAAVAGATHQVAKPRHTRRGLPVGTHRSVFGSRSNGG